MSATNDASQSENSSKPLIDLSSGAASTKKRDAPSDTSEDDAAPASDAAPDTSSASRDAPKRRRVEDPAPTSVPALEKIRQKLGTEPADLARPDEAVRLFSQRPGDSTCCYRTFMTLIFALCTLGEYRGALLACGLVRASGIVASVREIQGAIEEGWFWGFGFKGASLIWKRLKGAEFVGSTGLDAWIGCVEAGAALRRAGVRANVVGFDGQACGALSAARDLVTRLAIYFAGRGDGVGWGADLLPPALLAFDGHSRAVVGVSRGRLVLLDPAWRAPRLECVSAGDLASRADQFEILVVRPGVRDANTLPKDFKDQA